jgi:hypothetical protein
MDEPEGCAAALEVGAVGGDELGMMAEGVELG